MSARGHRFAEDVPVTSRKCVLCGKPYKACACTCTYCGTKKWTLAPSGWSHHVCAGRR